MLKSVQMCSNVFNVLKTCSNMLVLAVISGYGWVFGGNGCFLVVTSNMSAYGVNRVVFWGSKWLWVFLGGLWVAKVGFQRLKVVIGGYEPKICPR